MQFSDKKPTVSGKIVWGDMAIRAQVVAPPIVEGGMAITFRPFKVAADQLIEPGSCTAVSLISMPNVGKGQRRR